MRETDERDARQSIRRVGVVAPLAEGSRLAWGVAGALIVAAALAVFVTAGDDEPKKSNGAVRDGMVVMDDFESGVLNDWQAVGAGAGGWFAYTDGQKSPDRTNSDPNVPFDLPDPPQGKFAAATETNGPGTRILYRD